MYIKLKYIVYIGESDRPIQDRFGEHKGYVKTKNTTNQRWNISIHQDTCHTVNNMKITILERVKKMEELYRNKRQKYLIQ